PVSVAPAKLAPTSLHSAKRAPNRLALSKVELAKSEPTCSDPLIWARVKSQPRNVHPVVRSPERSCPRKLSFSKTSFSSSASRSGLIAHLGEQPLEPRLGRVVDERHRRSDARMDGGDRVPHLQGDGPVGGMALAAGAKLDQVQRLARVELEHVSDAIGEAERVRRFLGEPLAAQALVLHA